jgi:putative ubiquitin-RnfH superfamily antitoxin RatB of RatAB toxin-antitoxin module
MNGKINIEAVYALPGEQTLPKKSMPEWIRVAEVIRLCSIPERHPGADPAANKLGIKEVHRMCAEDENPVKNDGGKI